MKEIIIIRRYANGDFAQVLTFDENDNTKGRIITRKATKEDKKKAVYWWSEGTA